MSLAFGNPALLWGLLAAAVPLAIHLFFRRRPRATPFPAIEFILRAKRENERRVKLRRVLLFSARTLLLLAAALALTRPRIERAPLAAAAAPRGPAATALVLDASASMRYRLAGGALFARAKADVDEAIGALSQDDPASLVVCGGAAAEPTQLSYDRAALRRTLAEVEPSFAAADLESCVAAALRALAAEAAAALGKRVVIATDLTTSGWRLQGDAPTVNGVRPEVKLLDAARGAALPNLAIVELAADPDSSAGPRGVRITATVANYGEVAAKDVPIELRAGGSASPAPVLVKGFVDVPPGGSARKVFTHAFASGGPASVVAALPGDALDVDDTRTVAVAVPTDARALVVNGSPSPRKLDDEAFFVESALVSPASPVRPTVVDADALAKVRLADFQVVFLLDVRSVGDKAGELRQFVEGGGGLFVSVGEQVDPDVYARELGPLLPPLHLAKTAVEARGGARFADVDFAHPALAVFTGEAEEGLLGARTSRYLLVRPGHDRVERVLARYGDGAPALVETRIGRGKVVLFTSTASRAWSDWPIRTSFLPAMQRFAAYLAGSLGRGAPAPAVVGTPRPVEAGEGRTVVAVVDPEHRERRGADLPPGAEPGSPPVITPDRPGLWQVKVDAGVDPTLAFAAVVDPRESDTRRVGEGELTAWFGGASHASVATTTRSAQPIPLWSVLLVVALGAFFVEGLLVS